MILEISDAQYLGMLQLWEILEFSFKERNEVIISRPADQSVPLETAEDIEMEDAADADLEAITLQISVSMTAPSYASCNQSRTCTLYTGNCTRPFTRLWSDISTCLPRFTAGIFQHHGSGLLQLLLSDNEMVWHSGAGTQLSRTSG